MANRIVRSIRAIRDIDKQPLFTNEQNDLLSDTNNDVYVRLARRYERITGLPALEQKFNSHLKDYNQFKDDTQNMLIFLNNENERQDKMIDKLNIDVDDLNKKSKRLKDITDEHTEKIKSITDDLNTFKEDVKNNREDVEEKLEELSSTLDEIKENDKQDKLQSEIEELRKTIEAIQSDLDESQMFDDLKQFYSVTSNVTENINGEHDRLYFDIHAPKSNLRNMDIVINKKTLQESGSWMIGGNYKGDKLNINNHNPSYVTVSIDISNLKGIQLFQLLINGTKMYERQVNLG